MAESKQGWDKRTWMVGLLGGLIFGNAAAWSAYQPVVGSVNRLAGFQALGSHSTGALFGVLFVTAALLLPGLVSGLAHRWTFVWGLVPLTLFLVAEDMEDWVESGAKDVANNFWLSLAATGGCLILSSGPVSLFRWLRARSRRRREAAVAFVQAQREAATVPREGVWPPPPDYRP